jgi:hypothetical protein
MIWIRSLTVMLPFVTARHSWSPKLTHNGKPWTGPDRFEDGTGMSYRPAIECHRSQDYFSTVPCFVYFLLSSLQGKLMMLPVDIALIAELAFRKWVEIYAKEEDKFFKVWCTAGSGTHVVSTCQVPSLPCRFYCLPSMLNNFASAFWGTFVVGSTKRNFQAVVSILVNSDPDPIST